MNPLRRGRPPKPPATHISIEPRPGGGIRFVTLPGPKPKKRGRPRNERAGFRRKLDEWLRWDSSTYLRRVRQIERDERLAVAAATLIRDGRPVVIAFDLVAHSHAVSYATARAAYYAHRARLVDD